MFSLLSHAERGISDQVLWGTHKWQIETIQRRSDVELGTWKSKPLFRILTKVANIIYMILIGSTPHTSKWIILIVHL
jgi:hypothetical protein